VSEGMGYRTYKYWLGGRLKAVADMDEVGDAACPAVGRARSSPSAARKRTCINLMAANNNNNDNNKNTSTLW